MSVDPYDPRAQRCAQCGPRNVETWTIYVCPECDNIVGELHWDAVDREEKGPPACPESGYHGQVEMEVVKVVRLSAFLAEREAREQAEQRCPPTCGARIAAEHLNAWLSETRAERDVAVARAEQAEREASDLLRQRDEWANHAAREGLRAGQAEAERDELRKKLRDGND